MKKLLLLVVVFLVVLWLVRQLLPPALPTTPHLAAVPVVRKPDHPPPSHPKRVTSPSGTLPK